MKWSGWDWKAFVHANRYWASLRGENGQEGVELALKERPDVIIMDIVMPELNGIDATLAILKEWPEAKIVILTSYLDNEKIYPVLDAGAKGIF